MKIRSSDGEEFEVSDEVVKEMETLKTMATFGDEEEGDCDEQIPTCAMDGITLKKILVWTECRNYFKKMDLKETFNLIISADFLANATLSEEMCKKVFLKNSQAVIDEAINQFEDGTIVHLLDDFKRKNEVVVTFHHDKLQYFDLKKSQWVTLTKIPEKVCNNKKSCAVKDRIYIFGDDDKFDWTHVVEYNTRTNIWRTLNSFEPLGESYENAFLSVGFLCSVGNKLYTRISWSKYEHYEANMFYDEEDYMAIKMLDLDDEDQKWKEVKLDDYEELTDPAVAVEDDCIYLVGGGYEVEKYDVKQDLWTTVTEMSDEMSSSDDIAVAVLDGKIYVSDGVSFECYDTSTENWTSLASMNHGRTGHSLLVKNGSIVVVGGEHSSIEEYDVANDTWTVKVENLDEIPEGGFIMMKYYLEQE